MSIYKKLIEMQKRVVGLGKDTKSFGYQYVSGGKVLENLKPVSYTHLTLPTILRV